MVSEDDPIAPTLASPRRLGVHIQDAASPPQQPHSAEHTLSHVHERNDESPPPTTTTTTTGEEVTAGEMGEEGLGVGESSNQDHVSQALPLEPHTPDVDRAEIEAESEPVSEREPEAEFEPDPEPGVGVDDGNMDMNDNSGTSPTFAFALDYPLTDSVNMDDVDPGAAVAYVTNETAQDMGAETSGPAISPPLTTPNSVGSLSISSGVPTSIGAMFPPLAIPGTGSLSLTNEAMQLLFAQAQLIPPMPLPTTAHAVSAVLILQNFVTTSAPEMEEDDEAVTWFPAGHPAAPNTLGSNNPGLIEFLHAWASDFVSRLGCRAPLRVKAIKQTSDRSTCTVRYADLQGDGCDFQGLDWRDMGVTRMEARRQRLRRYQNYVTYPDSDSHWREVTVPRTDSFFRFRRMDIRRNAHIAHFQLRHVLASLSSTHVFYTGERSVHHINTATGEERVALKPAHVNGQDVTALDAGHGVLVAGGFGGDYVVKRLFSDHADDDAGHAGLITTHQNAITNHVRIEESRSSGPRVAFVSNDWGFRIMDLTTEKYLSYETYPFALNCTALSPDRRLRVAVGDHRDVFITSAEPTGSSAGRDPDVLQQLWGHRDWGFACDWADDGWTVATGFQDKVVTIWDARKWTDSSGVAQCVCELRSEMSGVRSLRFSPIGSGRRVLVAAEEADMLNIYDARSFESKQTFDVFGEIGGTTFVNDGRDLIFLVGDRARGGLVHLERCGEAAHLGWNPHSAQTSDDGDDPAGESGSGSESATYDWPPSMFTEPRRYRQTETQRRRAGVMDMLEPF